MQMTKASGACVLDAGADRVHHLEIDAEEVVAAHAGLARDARGDDDDIGACDGRIVARAGEPRVEALDWARLREIKRLSLRNAVDDVEEDDVAELLHRGKMRQRAADLAGSDQSNFPARHGSFRSFSVKPLGQPHVTMPRGPGGSRACYPLIA